MIVVESGGSKSTWIFKNETGEVISKSDVGLHPREITNDKKESILEFINEYNLAGRDVYFYGAGCESKKAKESIKNLLTNFGLNVKQVETDIYAACLSTLGDKDGVVSILGTGAIAAKFENGRVVKMASGLGYMLGDEGSGYDIGKRLLRAYFYNELPSNILEDIEDYFKGEPILNTIYGVGGRKLVAGLTGTVVEEHRNHIWIQTILTEAFLDFHLYALVPLKHKGEVQFIGSVAYYFYEELKMSLDTCHCEVGIIKQQAAEGVWNYLNKTNKKDQIVDDWR